MARNVEIVLRGDVDLFASAVDKVRVELGELQRRLDLATNSRQVRRWFWYCRWLTVLASAGDGRYGLRLELLERPARSYGLILEVDLRSWYLAIGCSDGGAVSLQIGCFIIAAGVTSDRAPDAEALS